MPLSHARLTRFLATTDYFDGVDPLSLSRIANRFEVLSVSRGELLFEEGTIGEAWYIVVDGGVDITGRDAAGGRVVLTRLSSGDAFGEIALLDSVTRTASASANQTTTLAKLPRESFEKLLREGNTAAAMMLYGIAVRMSRRLRALSEELKARSGS